DMGAGKTREGFCSPRAGPASVAGSAQRESMLRAPRRPPSGQARSRSARSTKHRFLSVMHPEDDAVDDEDGYAIPAANIGDTDLVALAQTNPAGAKEIARLEDL